MLGRGTRELNGIGAMLYGLLGCASAWADLRLFGQTYARSRGMAISTEREGHTTSVYRSD